MTHDDKPVVILLEEDAYSDEDEKSPLISTSAKPISDLELSASPSPVPPSPVPGSHADNKEKVKFQLGKYNNSK